MFRQSSVPQDAPSHSAAPQSATPHRANAPAATWSSERVEQLMTGFRAGLTCSQIANDIGVTRNAVIGKMNRLGLSRPRDVISRQFEQGRAARLARPKQPRGFGRKRLHLNILAQHEMLATAFPDPPPRAAAVPIHNGRGCTLLELGQHHCRWPINSPGADDFCFCGNEPLKGLPYCPGHSRMAYRRTARPRMSARA